MHGFYESVIPLCLFIVFLSVVFLLSVNDDVKHFELPLKMCYINKRTLPKLNVVFKNNLVFRYVQCQLKISCVQ